MIFTSPEISRIRQGKQQATLVPQSEKITPGRTRLLRRLIVVLDGDGHPTGERRREYVRIPTDNGEWRREQLTIFAAYPVLVAAVSLPDARLCGFRTAAELRADWRRKHPHMDAARLVHFGLGDQRDLPRFLSITGTGGSDYTAQRHRSADPDAEALTAEQLAALAVDARQRHLRHRADIAGTFATESLAARMERVERARERATSEVRAALRHDLRVAAQRISRAERIARRITELG